MATHNLERRSKVALASEPAGDVMYVVVQKIMTRSWDAHHS